MYYKNQLEELYEKIAASINISEEMFDAAEAEYKKLGKWIEDNTPQYDIDIYPQGSFALGTVVKPFDREDEYDLDLVCEYQKDYGLDARQLKTKEVR
jgi:tRNA nucleotidyltransferase (CCA-adding enzyme)